MGRRAEGGRVQEDAPTNACTERYVQRKPGTITHRSLHRAHPDGLAPAGGQSGIRRPATAPGDKKQGTAPPKKDGAL
jgi:hypothetical protein